MSIWKLVQLQFDGAAHFGEVGIGIEATSDRLRSDSLFSSWINAFAQLFGKEAVEELLQRFLNQPPPVRMSSTFIYQRNGQDDIYYLPRPLKFPVNYPANNDLEFFKSYKKLAYLPLKVWQRWYQGEGFTKSDRAELIDETKGKSNGKLRGSGTFDYSDACKIGRVPKIAVDRATRATNLYHTGFVQYNLLSGLYFLLEFPQKDERLENNLHAALQLLGEMGVGGERSSGAGRFEVEWLELPPDWKKAIQAPQGATHHCSISLFWDSDLSEVERVMGTDTAYELLERSGWISSPFSGRQLRRKSIQMFAEGSVFSAAPTGKLADVTPTEFKAHRIYRNGICMSLPIKLAPSE